MITFFSRYPVLLSYLKDEWTMSALWVNCECTLSIIQWMLIWVANKEHKRSAKWTVNARWTIFECKMYNLFGVPSSWELSWHWISSVIRKKIANKLVHVHVHCRSHESWQNNSILSYSRIPQPILQKIFTLSYPIPYHLFLGIRVKYNEI